MRQITKDPQERALPKSKAYPGALQTQNRAPSETDVSQLGERRRRQKTLLGKVLKHKLGMLLDDAFEMMAGHFRPSERWAATKNRCDKPPEPTADSPIVEQPKRDFIESSRSELANSAKVPAEPVSPISAPPFSTGDISATPRTPALSYRYSCESQTLTPPQSTSTRRPKQMTPATPQTAPRTVKSALNRKYPTLPKNPNSTMLLTYRPERKPSD